MAVVSCNELPEWSGALWTLEGKKYTRGFKVRVSQRTDGASVAIGAGGLPTRMDAHPDDADCVCFRLHPMLFDKEGMFWRVNVEYEEPTRDTPNPNPLNDPVQIEWTDYSIIEALTEDRDGTKILNSAGDPFDPPPEQEVSYPEVLIVRNVSLAAWSPTRARDFRKSVNSDWVTIAGITLAANVGRIMRFDGRLAERNNVEYYTETISIAFAVTAQGVGTWDRSFLNHGLYQLTGGTKVRIQDDQGNDVVAPWRLDAAGARLATGGAATVETFSTYKEQDFRDLSLPTRKDGT